MKRRTTNLSKLPQTTSEGQDIKRLEGDKQLVIELNINKNGISVSGVTIQGWETQGNGVGRHHHRITKSKVTNPVSSRDVIPIDRKRIACKPILLVP